MVIAFIVLILICIFLFLIFPSLRRHPDRQVLSGLKIAHRGYHDNNKTVPENSLLSARLAMEKGYAIENDIHLTADGEVVVFHDDTLDRVCGVNGLIEEKTLAQLKELRLAGTKEQIPTLKEFLDTVDGAVPLLIEIKCSGPACYEICKKTSEILKSYKGKYLVQSFYPPALGWFKKHRPDVLRGQLSCEFPKDAFYKKLLSALLYNFISRPDFVSYKIEDSKNIFRKLVTFFGAMPVGWVFRSDKQVQEYGKHYETYIFEYFDI